MVLVLVCILPIQWLTRKGQHDVIVARRNAWIGRGAARRS